ncbi:MAG: hypothetical protein IKD69_16475, partial [Solobacterium sp.]|nr:hypothetical protein [Solobacterium sp.]
MQRSSKNVWTRIQSGLLSVAMVFGMFTATMAGANAEGESELHTFTATNLTAAADKEVIPDGTAVDDQGTGYIVTFGEVTKRTSSSTGEVTSTEVGKNAGSGFTFTVSGTADVSMTVSSTGGSNTSAIGIIDGNGAAIANNEGITEVTATTKQTLTYALEAGTYKIVSPESEYNRGARVYYIEVSEKAAGVEPEPEPEDSEWQFTYFGVSVNANRNRLISAGEGIEEDVVLGSAIFNEDGSISEKGGKFVADSPADGGSYYYTVIDPTKKNFYFQADVIIDQLNPAMDGQEGFALMARDAIGGNGESGNWMANLISVTGTKLPTEGINGGGETKGVIGVRAYTGIKTPEPSEENEIAATRYSWAADGEGNTAVIEQGGTYRVSLEKTDYAYITSEYRINEDGTTGDKIGEHVYYIPAKDHNATSVSSYSDLDDPLTYQEADKAYIAMVVARGINATFHDIVFTTSDWNAEGWQPQPTTYIPLEAEITSPSTTTGGTYELVFKANADGTAKIMADADVLEDNVEIKANTYYKKEFAMTSPTTTYQVYFTPDPDYVISAFEKLESYDTVTVTKTVTQKTIGDGDTIYVKPDGSPSNGGTSMDDAVDIFTAVSYAGAGQTILLASETYDLSGKALTIARGRSGTAEKPITMKTVDDGFATFDFG